ncbi:MAG TPA: YueI family protein [Clostridia bacterium]|nr:YueI family protein [Clostridia bacterium]
MTDKTELERTIEYAIRGAPQIKADEKRKWLGEFRERVILGLTVEQSHMEEALCHVEDALKHEMADIIIVNQDMLIEMMAKYMRLAKDTGKRFKSVATDSEEAMGLVVASSEAVKIENVERDLYR